MLAIMLMWAATLATPAAASAQLSWSGPVPVDEHGGAWFFSLACASARQCTAIGGGMATFDPHAPASASLVLARAESAAIACPSLHQCITVGGREETTFDPTAPAHVSHAVIDDDLFGGSYPALDAVSCVSVTQCTAVNAHDKAVTFNPQAPGTSSMTSIDPGNGITPPVLEDVACASSTQCTAVDDQGAEITFDPLRSAGPSVIALPIRANAVACPTTTQCIAIDGVQRVTFNPQAPGTPQAIALPGHDSADWTHIACPTAERCVAVDGAGRETTFDPNSTSSGVAVTVDRAAPNNWLSAVACPTATLCVASDGSGDVVSFIPGSGTVLATAALTEGSAPLAISCPSAHQCTETDRPGFEVTFDPAAPEHATSAALDPSARHGVVQNRFAAISCPVATQCTAVSQQDPEVVTFDPQSPGSPTPTPIANEAFGMTGVDCPSTVRCVAVDGTGHAIRFDPTEPGHAVAFAAGFKGELMSGISCMSSTRCTAIGWDASGTGTRGTFETTFDPSDPGTPSATRIGPQNGSALACVSATQCYAADWDGYLIAFDPGNPLGATRARIGGLTSADGLACASSALCLVSGRQTAVLDPRSPASAQRFGFDFPGATCAGPQLCVGIDGIGDAYVYGPTPGPPQISIAIPSPGATYSQDAQIATSFSCSDGTDGMGIRSCLDQQRRPSGATLDTSTLGSHVLTVTATSWDGHSSRTSVSYTVAAAARSGGGGTTTSPSAPGPGSSAPPSPVASPTLLVVSLPARICSRVSTGRVCLARGRHGVAVVTPAAAAWRGRVRLSTAAGRPVADAPIRISDGGWTTTVVTAADGGADFAIPRGPTAVIRLAYTGSPADAASSLAVDVRDRAVATLYLVRGARRAAHVLLAGVAVTSNDGRARQHVVLQRLRGRRWVTVAVLRTSRIGWWNAWVPRPASTRSTWRTVLDGTPALPTTVHVRA